MQEIFGQYWWLFLVVFLIGLAVAWWVLVASRRTRVEIDKRDVLDEGTGPTQRNQALIDAPAAALSKTPESADKARQPSAESSPASGDDLTKIKGLGPKLAAILAEMDVTSYAQIAAWDDAQIDRIDSKLGRFEGRIRRDSWVEQAKLLAAGNEAQFHDKFGATKA